MSKKLQDEIVILENQIAEMQRTIGKLKSEVSDKPQSTIDYALIEKDAANNVYINHTTSDCEDELVYKYCLALALLAENSESDEDRIKQYYHIFRIYHSKKTKHINEELLRDAKLISISELQFLKDNYTDEQLENYFVDLILMVMIGSMQEKQFDYINEIAAFFGVEKQRIKVYCHVAKAILEKSEDSLLELVREININNYYTYLGFIPEYYVIPYMSQINKSNQEIIMVYGDKIQDMKYIIDIDMYEKKELYFNRCIFENIRGIKSEITKTQFHKCEFTKHKQQYEHDQDRRRYYYQYDHFIKCNNTIIHDSVFEDIEMKEFGKHSSIFEISNSTISECDFVNCQITLLVDDYLEGYMLHAINSKINNNKFVNCSIYGAVTKDYYNVYRMRIVFAEAGRVINNFFEKCTVSYKYFSDSKVENYIVTYDKSFVADNEFFECDTEQRTRNRWCDTVVTNELIAEKEENQERRCWPSELGDVEFVIIE